MFNRCWTWAGALVNTYQVGSNISGAAWDGVYLSGSRTGDNVVPTYQSNVFNGAWAKYI